MLLGNEKIEWALNYDGRHHALASIFQQTKEIDKGIMVTLQSTCIAGYLSNVESKEGEFRKGVMTLIAC